MSNRLNEVWPVSQDTAGRSRGLRTRKKWNGKKATGEGWEMEQGRPGSFVWYYPSYYSTFLLLFSYLSPQKYQTKQLNWFKIDCTIPTHPDNQPFQRGQKKGLQAKYNVKPISNPSKPPTNSINPTNGVTTIRNGKPGWLPRLEGARPSKVFLLSWMMPVCLLFTIHPTFLIPKDDSGVTRADGKRRVSQIDTGHTTYRTL